MNIEDLFRHNELFKTAQDEWHALERMSSYGGSFVKQLRNLYELGDSINKAKLRRAFKGYFVTYRDWKED